jgi:hypothetical protein
MSYHSKNEMKLDRDIALYINSKCSLLVSLHREDLDRHIVLLLHVLQIRMVTNVGAFSSKRFIENRRLKDQRLQNVLQRR